MRLIVVLRRSACLLLVVGVGGPWFIIVAISKYREDRSLFKNSRERWYTWAAIEERDEDYESACRRRRDRQFFDSDRAAWYQRAEIKKPSHYEDYRAASGRRDREGSSHAGLDPGR